MTAYAAVSFSPASTFGHSSAMIRALLVDQRVHARFEIIFPQALGVVEELVADGTVDLISPTDHTPGPGQYRDIERYVETVARN